MKNKKQHKIKTKTMEFCSGVGELVKENKINNYAFLRCPHCRKTLLIRKETKPYTITFSGKVYKIPSHGIYIKLTN